jgi:hypothetical protein
MSGVLGNRRRRNDCDFAIDAVFVCRKSREGADALPQPRAIDIPADRLNNAGRFIADFGWEHWRETISALTKMHFCSIQSEGLYTESDLNIVRSRKWKLVELKNLRGPNLVKSDYPRVFRKRTIPHLSNLAT